MAEEVDSGWWANHRETIRIKKERLYRLLHPWGNSDPLSSLRSLWLIPFSLIACLVSGTKHKEYPEPEPSTKNRER